MKPEPPVKANGRCFVCDKPRPEVAVKHNDPFCSTECCRIHHDVHWTTVTSTIK